MISITKAIKNGFYRTFCLRDKRMMIPIVVFFFISIAANFISSAVTGQPFMQAANQSTTSSITLGQAYTIMEFGIPSFVAIGLIGLFFTGFTIVAYASKKTRHISIVMRDTAKRYVSLLGASILTGLILIASFIALVIPGIFFSVKLAFSEVSAVLKKTSATKSISYSYEMTKGKFWDVLAMLLIVFLIIGITESVVSFVLSLQPIYAVSNVIETAISAFFTVAAISVLTDYFLQVNKRLKV